ncbi:hypothetical protein Scani_47500 [Streptomyces caniferus]|uniref:Uncharacterized protein n=1 Tax=Streptomyces caniferus TaxID=285557 RepID=A0A640SDB5_9ACTN|nr:hypothetical protein Scani_47500 [Streptomyces caniferus]
MTAEEFADAARATAGTGPGDRRAHDAPPTDPAPFSRIPPPSYPLRPLLIGPVTTARGASSRAEGGHPVQLPTGHGSVVSAAYRIGTRLPAPGYEPRTQRPRGPGDLAAVIPPRHRHHAHAEPDGPMTAAN